MARIEEKGHAECGCALPFPASGGLRAKFRFFMFTAAWK
ncbi:hypothetical protein AB434_3864 [Heyndrickxia coagulans]|uniref:Uncharacterized protein n=1 Tax=Heyndrickxia coagulans TaxID=1398 RepID=A0A0C5C6D2_HEYCO|nr:hypothetical protein SB48_HM08orf02207 [Heyndrickxia coagulans]AKN56269.1 hypothetical protein AB434_3864 [Heyndrickxia coagulans]KYC58776.1 hypothetical protein B4098_2468 [Heyndrickxia coagulans]KYC64597.1 hypothetical protein B4100_2679 [Heyndrickxia coagulans]KYC92091.1 hypothetical protein B4096_3047 [Heyndrickxia coagulans]